MNVQADLGLPRPLVPEDIFSHGLAYILHILVIKTGLLTGYEFSIHVLIEQSKLILVILV